MSAILEVLEQKVEQSAPTKEQFFCCQCCRNVCFERLKDAFLNGARNEVGRRFVELERWLVIEEILRKEFNQELPRSHVKGAIFRD